MRTQESHSLLPRLSVILLAVIADYLLLLSTIPQVARRSHPTEPGLSSSQTSNNEVCSSGSVGYRLAMQEAVGKRSSRLGIKSPLHLDKSKTGRGNSFSVHQIQID